jgi:hypothetical protein
MRPLNLGSETCRDPVAERKFQEIERASKENDPAQIAADFTLGTYTELRTINVGTSTLTETQQFLATLIADLAAGGQHRV